MSGKSAPPDSGAWRCSWCWQTFETAEACDRHCRREGLPMAVALVIVAVLFAAAVLFGGIR